MLSFFTWSSFCRQFKNVVKALYAKQTKKRQILSKSLQFYTIMYSPVLLNYLDFFFFFLQKFHNAHCIRTPWNKQKRNILDAYYLCCNIFLYQYICCICSYVCGICKYLPVTNVYTMHTPTSCSAYTYSLSI